MMMMFPLRLSNTASIGKRSSFETLFCIALLSFVIVSTILTALYLHHQEITTSPLLFKVIRNAVVKQARDGAWKPLSPDLYNRFYSKQQQQQQQQQRNLKNNNAGPACAPKYIHLAQRTNVNKKDNTLSMTVSMSLDYEHCGSVKVFVLYGNSDNEDDKHSVMDTNPPLQFNYTSNMTDTINYQSDWVHHIELPNVKAGIQEYWYRILIFRENTDTENLDTSLLFASHRRRRLGTMNENLLTETTDYTFRTPPLPGQPTSMALVGDLGQTVNSSKTMAHILSAATENKTDDDSSSFAVVTNLLIAGDLSYANADPTRWTSWFELAEPLLSTLPMAAAAGNHEIECNTDTNDIFVPFETYFYNPNRIQEAHMEPITDEYRKTFWNQECTNPSEFQGIYEYGNSFFSYIHGMAHVIVLNSYTSTHVNSTQYNWFVEEVTTKFNRAVTPWLIVTFHSPMWTSFLGHNHELEAMNMKKYLEPLFHQYNVNLVVNGHDHAYLRTKSMYISDDDKMTVDPTGRSPVYVTLGAGGEGHQRAYIRPYRQEEWVAKRTLQDYGYGLLQMVNSTHAHFEWVKDYIEQPEFQDEVWLINPHALEEE